MQILLWNKLVIRIPQQANTIEIIFVFFIVWCIEQFCKAAWLFVNACRFRQFCHLIYNIPFCFGYFEAFIASPTFETTIAKHYAKNVRINRKVFVAKLNSSIVRNEIFFPFSKTFYQVFCLQSHSPSPFLVMSTIFMYLLWCSYSP